MSLSCWWQPGLWLAGGRSTPGQRQRHVEAFDELDATYAKTSDTCITAQQWAIQVSFLDRIFHKVVSVNLGGNTPLICTLG